MSTMVIGSKEIETSTGKNQEIVNYRGKNNEFTTSSPFRSVTFTAVTNCLISINGADHVLVPAGANISFSRGEIKINSLKVKDSGSKFHWIACI